MSFGKRDAIAPKLFTILVLLGLINITIAYSFFYFTSVSLLEERAWQQMNSVRVLASEQLKLYLKHLKSLSFQAAEDHGWNSEENEISQNLDSVFLSADSKSWEKVKGLGRITELDIARLPSAMFVEVSPTQIGLKIDHKNESILFIFSYHGINKILSQKAGLGESGEIYLVGQDQWVRSASRHFDEKRIKVPDQSIKLASVNKSGVHIVRDYRDVEVVSAFSAFSFDELHFTILSEIDRDEIIRPLTTLLPKVYVVCAIICILTLLLALYFGRSILKMIDDMKRRINDLHLKLITTSEEEKRKISMNLHDGVGQIVTALKWGISQNEKPERLKELCDEAVREVRTVSYNLMPSELRELGLFTAIKNDFRKNQDFYKIEMSFWYNEKLSELRFKEGLDVNIYRMVQELVQNSMKHSQANSISLVMFKEYDKFILRYEDNGIGMNDSAPMPRVLQYRADLMGALIHRSGEKGLIYKIEVPMEKLFHESDKSIST